jgi:NDP-sugar pyrophosphorylase family protein
LMAVLLAGGGVLRSWPLIGDVPTALLPLGHSTPLDLILQKIEATQLFDQVLITIHPHWKDEFRRWALENDYESIEIVVEPSTAKGNFNPVKALSLAIRGIHDDCLVMPCDNVFSSSLTPIVSFFKTIRSPVVALRRAQNLEETRGYSNIDANDVGRVTEIIEGPLGRKSNVVQTDISLIPAKTLSRVHEYVSEGLGDGTLSGFTEWLSTIEPIHGYFLDGHWFDIDTPESYLEALGRTVGHSSIIVWQCSVFGKWTKTKSTMRSKSLYARASQFI